MEKTTLIKKKFSGINSNVKYANYVVPSSHRIKRLCFVHGRGRNVRNLFNKLRSVSRVLHSDKTRRAFENTREMLKLRAASECFYIS